MPAASSVVAGKFIAIHVYAIISDTVSQASTSRRLQPSGRIRSSDRRRPSRIPGRSLLPPDAIPSRPGAPRHRPPAPRRRSDLDAQPPRRDHDRLRPDRRLRVAPGRGQARHVPRHWPGVQVSPTSLSCRRVPPLSARSRPPSPMRSTPRPPATAWPSPMSRDGPTVLEVAKGLDAVADLPAAGCQACHSIRCGQAKAWASCPGSGWIIPLRRLFRRRSCRRRRAC